jgi:putative transposase
LSKQKSSKHLPTVSMSDLGLAGEAVIGQPLDLIAREGARVILEIALSEEIDDFLGRHRYERKTEAAPGYRNGSRERTVQCGAGEITIRRPKIVGAEQPFQSRVMAGWGRKSEYLEQVLPALYVEGLSTRDFKRALKPLLGGAGLSRSSISRVNRSLKESFSAWRKRDLSEEKVMYLFLDGYYLGLRRGGREKDALLIAHGVREDGSRVLLGVYLGGRESTDSWKGALQDLLDRGLAEPRLIITDGNPGLLRAMKEVMPKVPNQRCTAHRTRNVLARVKKSRQAEVKRALDRIFQAACLEDALKAADEFNRRYGKEFPTATQVLAKGLAQCLTFYHFPEVHWKRIRTSNVLERAFLEVRRRTNVIGRLPDEMSALSLVFGILEQDRLKWRGLRMDDDIRQGAVLGFKQASEPIIIGWAEKMAA